MELEVFNSSQNKTTEQKYAELKQKYNDLLSKHFALAAQKTEDGGVRKSKQSVVSLYYGGLSWGPAVQLIVPDTTSMIVQPSG